MSSNDIVQRAPHGSQELANIDDLFDEAGQEGLEHVKPGDIVLPRLAILQPTSPLSQEDGYKSGDLVNILTGFNFGKSIKFHPILFWGSRINWVDAALGGDIDCQSRNGEVGTKKDAAHAGGDCGTCPMSKWGEDGTPPHCTEFKNLLVRPYDAASWSEEEVIPIVFSGKRTGAKPVTQMLSTAMLMTRNNRPVPLYACSWQLETVKQQNDQGIFYTPKFSKGAIVEDAATFMGLREMYGNLSAAQGRIVVPEEREEATASTGPSEF